MPSIRLKGLNRVAVRLKDGRRVVYWYAWKGGPRLEGAPGSSEFIASYNRAVQDARALPKDTLAGLVLRYQASPEWNKNAASTKAEWGRWLSRICADQGDLDIGDMPLQALDNRKAKAEILAWRDQWAATPRKADYAMQVLSRVLSWGLARGELALNVAAGVEQLYSSDRADLVWTAADVDAYVAKAKSPEVGFIVRLACLTGLRREDLATLAWAHVGDMAIIKPTGKSRRGSGARGEAKARRNAVIPILPELRTLLGEIRAQQAARHAELCAIAERKRRPAPPAPLTVLINTRGRPWSPDGLEHQVIDAKTLAAVDKHLHDCRGTFGTRLRKAGLKASEIADVLGWEEKRVERLLATYVDRDSIIAGIAERINRNESGS